MIFNSPISSAKADHLISLLPLGSGSRIIDVGCGTGEFIIRLVKKFSAKGIGIDTDPVALESARKSSGDRECDEQIQFLEKPIHEYQSDSLFDCGICMGATHAYSMGEPAYAETLRGLGKIVRVGGVLLIGEGYWMQPLEPEYLEFIGEPVGIYRTHRENVELAESFGLRALYATTSNLDEWDDFEWSHHMKVEENAQKNPEDDGAIERRNKGRAWRSAYLKWGRGTMGFGFYLFRRED